MLTVFSMTNPEFRTLAYSKSPKSTRRTTFQDELQAAVSARASKTKPSLYSYYDDFDEDDDDDFLQRLVKLRKQRTGALKSVKSKSKTSTFDLSDDDSKENKTKKVSFLKSQRTSFFSNNTTGSESRAVDRQDSSISRHSNYDDSFESTNPSEDDIQVKNSNVMPIDHQNIGRNLSDSLSYQTSDDTLLDVPLPLPSDGSVAETPGPEEKSISSLTPQLSTSDLNHTPLAGDVSERQPPKPKPRQRTLGLNLHAVEKPPDETECQDISRPQTSSASIPCSNDISSNTAVRSYSPQYTNEDRTVLSANKSEQSQLITNSTVGSGSRDGFLSDDSKEQGRHCFTSLEEPNYSSGDLPDQLSHVPEKSSDTKTSGTCSQATNRSHSVCSGKVESKYLGRLKVLDQKVSLQDSQPQAADSLRAAIYQDWLKKKRENSRGNMQIKKKEEIQRETKKREQETKKEDAIMSYNAWKERKTESLRAKAKEREDFMRKEQQATEDKEEKRESAKKVFEKWKREHDHLLKEKYRKQKDAENKLKMKKQEKEEQRRHDSTSAFTNWSEKKKNVLHEKHVTERKTVRTKAQEEQYMKEEREKMALETYENWLARKDLEQKRQREERQIQAILNLDNSPPPWSPPNKTVPFGK